MKLINKIIIAIFALGTLFVSCDTLLYGDLEDCTQGVYVKFYSMTPCDTDSSFIGDVESLTLLAFDENEKLAIQPISRINQNLTTGYDILVPLPSGSYTFVAWAGTNDNFDLKSLKPGTTTKKDVMLALKSNDNTAPNLTGTQVWQGESTMVVLPDVNEFGSVFKYTAVNLQQLTNKVNVTVTFTELMAELYDPAKFFVEISSESGTYNVDGTMPMDQPALQFPITESIEFADRQFTESFQMMDLQPKQGNLLKVYYIDEKAEDDEERIKVVFHGDLVGAILLATQKSDGEVNLFCQNEFDIRLDIIGACENCPDTYFSCDVWVKDWKVHSYSTELGW